MSEKAVYAKGELDRVKQRIGPIDEKEARRMQKVLGGEVGKERSESAEDAGGRRADGESSPAKKPHRAVDLAVPAEEESRKPRKTTRHKMVMPRLSYFERVKIDSFCAESTFGIKTPMQALISKLSFFRAPKDLVSPYFVKRNLDEYYKHIETLVTTVRLLLPKNNPDRAGNLKKMSLSGYLIVDTMRQWKINLISQEIAKLQSRPRAVYVIDFQPMLREIYRPLFLLENLSIETDIEDAFNLLYKVMFLEAPTNETESERKKMYNAIASFRYIRENVRYLMYPLLMKNIAEEYNEYDVFFTNYAEKYHRFLGVSEDEKIRPAMRTAIKNLLDEENGQEGVAAPPGENAAINDLIEGTPEEKAKKAEEERAELAEQKAFVRGINALEMLFPKAGWQSLNEYPDFFIYFAAILSFKKGCELISPLDPVQITLVLSVAIEEMLTGFRAMNFRGGTSTEIASILDEWSDTVDESFYNTYLRLVDEYTGVMQSSGGNTKTKYAMNLVNDIHWARRYYFFPLYEYKSGMPPSFPRKGIRSMFSIVRRLRKVLTDMAAEIEQANQAGGAKVGASCPSIENPWDEIKFPVANPISKRIEVLLPNTQKINVSLIFFVLAAATVLDNHMNSPSSHVYSSNNKEVFRSVNNEGREPILWVDKRTDVEAIFRESLASRKK